ncbi:MAG: hypothetical protein ACK5JR_12925 [Tropicimonas sp.]|uniref:hypothetical protein n=1 Tax=Tropicimonas sp. TaxID=2067044 RepID=UPI003A87873C
MVTLFASEEVTGFGWGPIAAVTEREPIRNVEAIILDEYLTHIHKGAHKVRQMICDDLRVAMHRDDPAHARKLFHTLKLFMAEHPETESFVA